MREALRASRYAIGSSAYVEGVEKMLRQERTREPDKRDWSLPRPIVPLEAIDESVAAAFGIAPEDLRRHGRSAGPAKAVALELACRLTDLNQRQIGAHYGGITSMAVSMARRRFRPAAGAECADLRCRLEELLSRLIERN